MGIYNEGILGFFRGKVGRVVGSVIRGVHYMKGLGDVRADNPTQKQLDQRLKFAMVMAFLKPLQGVLKTGFKAGKTGLSSLNKAMAANLNEAITGTSPNFTLDYSKIVLSKGNLQRPMAASVDIADGANLVFTWQNSGAITSSDQLTIVVYNIERQMYVVLAGAAARSAQTYTLQLPTSFAGEHVHMWVSFVSVDGTEVSNSEYIGTVEVF